MAYNYSKEWLDARKEDVVKLSEAATRRQTLEFTSDSAAQLQNQRAYVNNLLASIAVYYPHLANIRQILRTWIAYNKETGEWTLFVGPPLTQQRGRKPHSPLNLASAKYNRGTVLERKDLELLVERSASAPPSSYTHDKSIDSMEEYTRFVGRVSEALGMNIQNVKARFTHELEDVEFIRNTFEPLGWSVAVEDRHTIYLTRKDGETTDD